MTNRDKFNKEIITKNNDELAFILSNSPCRYCYYEGECAGVTCDIGVKKWLDAPCKDEPQEAIPTEVRVDLRKVAKEIVSECKEHYPNGCEDCRYGDSIGLCCFKQEPPIWAFGTADEATPPDMVNKPAHYVKGNMECIDFIRAIVSDLTPYEAYCLGNVVKYLWRFKDKNGVIDLDKAVRYIEFLKEAQGDEVEA